MRKLRREEQPTADDFNHLLQAVERLQRLAERESTPPFVSGAYPIEVRRHPGGIQIALAAGDEQLHVELTTNLSAGGTARTAKVLWYDGTSWQEAATEEITVHDVIGTMEGSPGDKALVQWHRQSGMWIVWQLQC